MIHFWRHEKRYGMKCPYSDNLHAIKSRLFLHPFTSLCQDRGILTLWIFFVKHNISVFAFSFIQCADLPWELK